MATTLLDQLNGWRQQASSEQKAFVDEFKRLDEDDRWELLFYLAMALKQECNSLRSLGIAAFNA